VDDKEDLLRLDFHSNPPYRYTAEVVGSTGRMGSFWLVHHRPSQDLPGDHSSSTIGCPRGISPGCLSAPDSPIYVATPSAAWKQIYEETLPSRRNDLCFVGNGLPPPALEDCTVVVPHFAIMEICRQPHGGGAKHTTPWPVQTSVESPPTYLYGKHARSMAAILESHGVRTQILESFHDIVVHAGIKLLWASCLWLVCHSRIRTITGTDHDDDDDGDILPMTIGQVLERRQGALQRLVDEMFPILQELVETGGSCSSPTPSSSMPLTRQFVDEYFQNYSRSISNAIPSKALALKEVGERNGVFFRISQQLHAQLLKEHVTEDICTYKLELQSEGSMDRVGVELDEIGLKAWGTRSATLCDAKQRVVVVGGGMIGSSVALSLARRRPNWDVTVIDQNPEHDMGKTTNASWAWINANNKFPKSYQSFNQLGVHAWKQHPELRNLVSWMGSLMRFGEYPGWVDDGGYPLEGPLTVERIKELEPLANFSFSETREDGYSDSGFTFFFPDEGCVEPATAVKILRQTAQNLGVRFICGHNVTNIIRSSDTGTVLYVEPVPSDPNSSTTTTLVADLVVAAAGCGISASFLGGVPLLERPGLIEYGRLNMHRKDVSDNPGGTYSMRRILVDAERSSHVLQRRNGDIVAGGGGKLEFGGTDSPRLSGPMGRNEQDETLSPLRLARHLAPSLIRCTLFSMSSAAVRPMPLDGLPVVGFHDPGLYNVVTHSGITLGPFLGAIAAAEITESVLFEILDPYRPSRFKN
jgi:glycine/D-amino acid oxidase-like deaminating enzyme